MEPVPELQIVPAVRLRGGVVDLGVDLPQRWISSSLTAGSCTRLYSLVSPNRRPSIAD